MKQLEKMSPFNIQVLEGVDPMSDANLAEIKGGIDICWINVIITTCPCDIKTHTTPPANPQISASESQVTPYLSFE